MCVKNQLVLQLIYSLYNQFKNRKFFKTLTGFFPVVLCTIRYYPPNPYVAFVQLVATKIVGSGSYRNPRDPDRVRILYSDPTKTLETIVYETGLQRKTTTKPT